MFDKPTIRYPVSCRGILCCAAHRSIAGTVFPIFSHYLYFFLPQPSVRINVDTQTTAGVHVSFLQENRYVSPVSIMEAEFFCSHLYDSSFFYHFHPFRVHFSDECFFIYPSLSLFPPVALYRTPIITAEDSYGFPERSILEDRKRKKASVPGPVTTKTAPDRVQQAEDLALKNAAAFFGSAFLKYLGISQSVSAVMPTEMIRLEVRHMYEDFNFQTSDGAWLHFEFESDTLSLADLKRFQEYEATTSRTHEVAVTTCVLCSAGQNSVKNSFHEGINTYRVKLIRLKRTSDMSV